MSFGNEDEYTTQEDDELDDGFGEYLKEVNHTQMVGVLVGIGNARVVVEVLTSGGKI